MKTLRTESDFQKAYEALKKAADHHAQNVSSVIDILYEAFMQLRDPDTDIIWVPINGFYTSLTVIINGKNYQFSYRDQQIILSLLDGQDDILATFDNNSTENEVFDLLKNL